MPEPIQIPDKNLPLERLIRERMVGMKRTLGLAESCTGGRISDRLTDIPGTSDYLKGSIVCYHVDVKETLLNVAPEIIRQHHVVSEQVAIEMAVGASVALEADYGFGVTGILGPDDYAGVAAGTVCMAVTNGRHTEATTYHFRHDRPGNKEAAARTGLWMIWKFINNEL